MQKKKKKKGDSDKDKESSSDSPTKKKKADSDKGKEAKPEANFQFGWINVMLIFGVGAICCVKLGLFDGDNVPDFVAKRDDLEYYFKSLAAPVEVNDTETDSKKKKKKKEEDPFAAPKDDESGRF